jgi:hypothetical protein
MRFSSEHINDFVLKKQHLTPGSHTNDTLEIVNSVVGLHATDFKTPFLSCFARSDDFRKESLYRELYQKRTLSKIKAMRNTLFIFRKEFVPTVFTALQGSVLKASALYLEKYMNMFGVDRGLYERASREILSIVGKESMDAVMIKKSLRERVPDKNLWKKEVMVKGSRKYQGPDAAGYIIYSLCDQCKLARVGLEGMSSNRQQYIRWDKWFPELKMKGNVMGSRKELIGSYINSFGPVTLRDVKWWTGFNTTEVTQVLEELDIVYVEWNGMESFEYFTTESDLGMLRKHKPSRRKDVTLLPVLDVYTMGYKDRDRLVEDRWQKSLYDRLGNAYPSILHGGRIIGVWRYPKFSGSSISPSGMRRFMFFGDVKPDVRKAVEKEYKRIVKFLSE